MTERNNPLYYCAPLIHGKCHAGDFPNDFSCQSEEISFNKLFFSLSINIFQLHKIFFWFQIFSISLILCFSFLVILLLQISLNILSQILRESTEKQLLCSTFDTQLLLFHSSSKPCYLKQTRKWNWWNWRRIIENGTRLKTWFRFLSSLSILLFTLFDFKATL